MVRGRADAAFEANLVLAATLPLEEEIAKLKMQVVAYRDFIESRGLRPPDKNGDDLLQMWRACQAVISAAQECVANLGTSKELLYPMNP